MSLLNNNSCLKKQDKRIHFTKSKTNNLLLTDFNKLSLFNCNSKITKKKLQLNNKTCSNNSIKNPNQKPCNFIYSNIDNKINFNFKNNPNTSKNNNNKMLNNNNNNLRDKKTIDIIDINNMPKQANKTIKCNSVNNLIGININVNYTNKNYSINKIRPNSYMNNYNNNFNIYNYNVRHARKNSINKNKEINHNNCNNKGLNNSFNEIIRVNNIPHSSSGKNKINRKNIFILNPLPNDWEKLIDNLKSKKMKKTKIDKKLLNKNNKNKIQLENKNSINSTEDNNNNFSYNINKTNFNARNIEKSFSSTNINCIPIQKKKTSNQINNNNNIFLTIMKNMNEKIKKLEEDKNEKYENKIYEIITEYFIKYSNEINNQYQKQLILEIFYYVNKIINQKENEIINIKNEKNKDYENLKKQNSSLIQKNKILENKINELSSKIKNISTNNININLDKINNNNNSNIISSHNNNDNDNDSLDSINNSSSSSVNTEELESIRFFDKIIMKKHSFLNIPELSFQKINNAYINEKDGILPINKNIKKRFSFQGNNRININIDKNKEKEKEKEKFNFKGIKNNINKRIINYCSGNIKNHKQKINIRYKQK